MTVDFEDPGAPGGEPATPTSLTLTAVPRKRRQRVAAGIRRLVDAISRSDDDAVERALLQLSMARRWLAPLGIIVGAFLMLFQGLKQRCRTSGRRGDARDPFAGRPVPDNQPTW